MSKFKSFDNTAGNLMEDLDLLRLFGVEKLSDGLNYNVTIVYFFD